MQLTRAHGLIGCLLLCCILTTINCASDPMISHYAQSTSINPLDLVGTYRPNHQTLSLIKANESISLPSSSSLILYGTHQFKLVNVPDWWRYAGGGGNGHLDNGTGHWSLQKHRFWEISFRPEAPPELALFINHCSCYAHVVGSQKPYGLYFTIGDPDTGLGMEYVLSNSNDRTNTKQ